MRGGRIAAILWAALAVGTLGLAIAQPEDNARPAFIAIGILWILFTAAALLPTPAQDVTRAVINGVRRQPIVLWLIILLVLVVGVGAWVAEYQPTNGRTLMPIEYAWACAIFWFVFGLLAYDMNRERARAIGAALGRSRLTGVMITITTFVLLFAALETYLRIFYVTTDSYGFTAMNYHWYNNFYWGHENSVGYRDTEPTPDTDGLTRIAIVGDSFAMGHGINNLDDTFGQIIEERLGDNYDVNIIAQSGWDSDVQEYWLDQYPYRPNVVVLSYYLNDIDYLLQAPEQNPDGNFSFLPEGPLQWFVLKFFVPNYVYYNLLQFTSRDRASSFLGDLMGAYTDDGIWEQQAARLNGIADWTARHNARLVVLLWPSIVAVEPSQPAIARVRELFAARGAAIVDMSESIRGRNPLTLIVNGFDAHPGVEAHRLAADALYSAIAALPAN